MDYGKENAFGPFPDTERRKIGMQTFYTQIGGSSLAIRTWPLLLSGQNAMRDARIYLMKAGKLFKSGATANIEELVPGMGYRRSFRGAKSDNA